MLFANDRLASPFGGLVSDHAVTYLFDPIFRTHLLSKSGEACYYFFAFQICL
jgi:hypothetical protein